MANQESIPSATAGALTPADPSQHDKAESKPSATAGPLTPVAPSNWGRRKSLGWRRTSMNDWNQI